MAYVIIGKCLGERYGACVDVCPVEAMHFGDHEGQPMMVINPDTCIDCGACLPECPIAAIVDTVDQAPEWAEYNKAAAAMWPNATQQKDGWEHRDPSEPPHNPANAKS
jgi:ferredoxin